MLDPSYQSIILIPFGVRVMNQQQRIAITNPCEVAGQCSDPLYKRIYRKGPYLVSVILTVNVGEE